MRAAPAGLALAAAVLIAAGCAAHKAPREAPAWVINPGFPRTDENYFYGSGSAPAEISNYFFRRDTARERARVDLTKVLYDYALEKTGGNTELSRAAVEKTLPLHEIAETYLAPDKSLHVLVRLSREKVNAALSF